MSATVAFVIAAIFDAVAVGILIYARRTLSALRVERLKYRLLLPTEVIEMPEHSHLSLSQTPDGTEWQAWLSSMHYCSEGDKHFDGPHVKLARKTPAAAVAETVREFRKLQSPSQRAEPTRA